MPTYAPAGSRQLRIHHAQRPGATMQAGTPRRAHRSCAPPLPAVCRPPLLVAREDELGQLARYLEAALAGETGVVFVSGDAGSGKTVLLEAFAASAMAEHPDLLVAGARCSPGGGLDPFAPLRRLADMLFGDLAGEVAWPLHGRTEPVVCRMPRPRAVRAGRAWRWTGRHARSGCLDRPQGRSIHASGRAESSARPLPLSQGALFDQLLRTLAAISREQPLLLLFDDLHWVDDATAAFLAHLGRELSRSRLLVLGAYRSATVSLGRRDPARAR